MHILIKKDIQPAGVGPVATKYYEDLKALEGTWQLVEPDHLFNDQFNIAKLRVYARHVEAVKGELREGLYCCNFTAQQSYNPDDFTKGPSYQLQRHPNHPDVFIEVRDESKFIEPPTVGYAILNVMATYKITSKMLLAAAGLSKHTRLRGMLKRNAFDYRILRALADFIPPAAYLHVLRIDQLYAAERLGRNGMFSSRDKIAEVYDYAATLPKDERAAAITCVGLAVNTLLKQLNLVSEND